MSREDQLAAQEAGRKFERDVNSYLGARLIQRSGAGFSKLDLRDLSILWSAKHTTRSGLLVTNSLFEEADRAVYGPGGVGDCVPGIVVGGPSIDGPIALLRLEHMVGILLAGSPISTPGSLANKSIVDMGRREPSLLREDEPA